MFEPYMLGAWEASTVVAVVAGIVGFFIVLRGDSFLAHAVPHGAFAGAAGAVLVGLNPLVGLGFFAAGGALAMSALEPSALSPRGHDDGSRNDAMTALTLTMMLALGVFFLSRSDSYGDEVMALLFGQILGVSTGDVLFMVILGALALACLALVWRPLLVTSILPGQAAARRISPRFMSAVFALIVACATTMSVPVVGALLMFVLLVAPPAAARFYAKRAAHAVALSVAFSLVSVWGAIALAYATDWPVGFYVTLLSSGIYLAARLTSRVGLAPRWRRL